jgi:hypothetical protein
VVLKRTDFFIAVDVVDDDDDDLTAETVQCAALSLQCVDDIHGGDSLALGVFGVRDSVTDDVLKEDFQYTASLFVDEAGDTFYTTTTCQTSDCWLCDTLDVITQNFAMTLRATFSQAFASFTATSHLLD